jgi:hypothetical protein
VAWKDQSQQDQSEGAGTGDPAHSRAILPTGPMGELRAREAGGSQQLSRTETRIPQPERPCLGFSLRYLGCCLSLSLCRRKLRLGQGRKGRSRVVASFSTEPLPPSHFWVVSLSLSFPLCKFGLARPTLSSTVGRGWDSMEGHPGVAHRGPCRGRVVLFCLSFLHRCRICGPTPQDLALVLLVQARREGPFPIGG